MSIAPVASAHLITDTVTITFEGELIPVHLEFLPSSASGAAGSIEMYDETDPHELPTALGDYIVDCFGTIMFDVNAEPALPDAIAEAQKGSAIATGLNEETGALCRTVRVYADSLTEAN